MELKSTKRQKIQLACIIHEISEFVE